MTIFSLKRLDNGQTLASTLRTVLRSPRRTIACFLLALAAAAGLYMMQVPQYTSRVDVVVIAVSGTSDAATEKDVSIDSAVQILYSDAVLGQTARVLDYPGKSSGLLDDLTIQPLINSRLLQLRISNPDAQLSYQAVNLLTENFQAARLARLNQQNAEARKALETTSESLRTQLTSMGSSELELRQRRELNRQLNAELSEAETAIAAIDSLPPSAGFISRQAVMPTEGSRSGRSVYLASALGVGLVAAVVFAPHRTQAHRLNKPFEQRQKVDIHG